MRFAPGFAKGHSSIVLASALLFLCFFGEEMEIHAGTSGFSKQVEAYIAARPSYPIEVVGII